MSLVRRVDLHAVQGRAVMPFVLLCGSEVVASGPNPDDFGAIGAGERVEFRADGSNPWDEIDEIKMRLEADARSRKEEFRSLRQKELGNRIVFAATNEWRFAAHRVGEDVVAYTQDAPVGSMRGMRSKRKRKIAQLQALGDSGEWCGVRASDLLVALDKWRDAGCPRGKPLKVGAAS